MKTLILITNFFPFKKGEEYLETEINFLSKEFEKVIIFSTMISSNEQQTRQVPNNVTIYSSNTSHTLFGKLKMVLKTCVSAYKNTNLDSNQNEYNSLLQKLYSVYFESRVLSLFPKIIDVLKTENIHENSNVVIYSYWFYVTAKLAVKLKLDYFNNHPLTISRAHGYDVDEDRSFKQFIPFRPYLLKNLDYLFPVSSYHTSKLKKKYIDYTDKIFNIPLGVQSRLKSNTQYQMLHNTFVSVSMIKPVKRLEMIISALKIVQEKGYNVSWIHFGIGQDFNKIKNIATQDLKENTFLFKGYVKNEELHQWYLENRPLAFINLSRYEGVPVSIMEASAYQIPILATNAGGTGDIVKNEQNGFLLPIQTNEKEVAEKIIEFITMDQNRYSNFSKNAYQIWNTHFNAAKLYKEFAFALKEGKGSIDNMIKNLSNY